MNTLSSFDVSSRSPRSQRRSRANRPEPSSPGVQKRMRATRRRDTPLELEVRSLLHRAGFRFRVDTRALPEARSRADIVFPKRRVAVFVDGCFWHSCPIHGSQPKANAEWWREKLAANRARDTRATLELRRAGWTVVRIWEHEAAEEAVKDICAVLGGQPMRPRNKPVGQTLKRHSRAVSAQAERADRP
jgi:DNA mismatch endonuclease (patch repair protein)